MSEPWWGWEPGKGPCGHLPRHDPEGPGMCSSYDLPASPSMIRVAEHALRLAVCLASWAAAVALLAHGHTALTIVALLVGAGVVLPWRQF